MIPPFPKGSGRPPSLGNRHDANPSFFFSIQSLLHIPNFPIIASACGFLAILGFGRLTAFALFRIIYFSSIFFALSKAHTPASHIQLACLTWNV